MPIAGVVTAIIENDRILLTRREDFEVWCLPGGAVDDFESAAQAAVREVREETGLEVELLRFVGVYYIPGWSGHGLHILLFVGRPTGGTLNPDPHEVVEMGYFPLSDLPTDFARGHPQMIADAISGQTGFARSGFALGPMGVGKKAPEIYAIRDESGLSRQAFYFQQVDPPEVFPMQAELIP